MTNVIIRNVDDDIIATFKRTAHEQGLPLQKYLLNTLREDAAQLQRRQALEEMDQYMHTQEGMTSEAISSGLRNIREDSYRSGDTWQ